MDKENSKRLKALGYSVLLLFLGWSTFSLMGNESQRPIQIGFGIVYITYALFAIYKRINFLTNLKIPKIKFSNMKNDFNFFYKGFIGIFAIFSSFVFVLATFKGVTNNWISSIWLLGVIFIFQGGCFLYLINYLDKHKPESLLRNFNFLYVILSILFGWTSAQIAFSILNLPAREDLFFATYGLLILPILFIIYFDYVFDYKSKDAHVITDIKYLFNNKSK